MKNTLLILVAAVIVLASLPADGQVRRNCGTGLKYQKMAVENPALLQQIREKRKMDAEAALAFMNNTAAKTTAQHPIPVVFHFILTKAQWNSVGNDSGIRRRVQSQLKSLNDDFNRRNADSTSIPAAFKSRYASADIQFGLANSSSANTISPGIEVKVLPAGTTPVYDVNTECYIAKEATAVGLPAWDKNKYLNIWVVNITSGGSGVILGVTTAPSTKGEFAGAHQIDTGDFGIVINYSALGVREFPAQFFTDPYNRGRTLTHEVGHYFELWHTWGDDGGGCPGSGGQDDDITDTPPEAEATYDAPTFPRYDACSPAATGSGLMFMNFMDYVDDRAMQMFTTEQCIRMRSFLVSQSYSLTQNPQLLGVRTATVPENAFRVFPNPTRDAVHIVPGEGEKLLSIDIVNMMGQRIAHAAADNRSTYDMRLDGASSGIYFVQCHFAEGTLTKKIVLE